MRDGDRRWRDEWAIRALACRYAQAFDENRGDLLASIFTPDGVLTAPNSSFRGTEALRGAPAIVASRYLRTFHAVLNQTVEFDGETAAVTTYGIARHLLPAEGVGYFCREMTLRYADDCVCVASAWLFSSRRLLLDWTQDYPVEPGPSALGRGV